VCELFAMSSLLPARLILSLDAFARHDGGDGPSNFLYSDGLTPFVHGHRRTQADGTIRRRGRGAAAERHRRCDRERRRRHAPHEPEGVGAGMPRPVD